MSGQRSANPAVSTRRRRRRSLLSWATSLTAAAFAATLAAIALGAGASMSIGSAAAPSLGKQVVVNAQGHTLYALTPETASRLLCKSRSCLKLWPPLTVSSRSVKLKAGAGVQGRLGILPRHNGVLQVTLAGKPLYRYSGDGARGEANGQGIKSFGGTWHAVTASSPTSAAPPSTPPATTPTRPTSTTPSYPGYGY